MNATPRVPGYELQRLLGRGSTGAVWQASAIATGVPVAVKLVADPGGARRDAIAAEAAALRVLDHPNLVRLHDVVAVDGAGALVLDLAGGGSLAGLLASRGRLTPGEVITALSPIGAALDHVHAAGVVHADVSAANVLFTEEGRPMLADLGMRQLAGQAAGTPRATPAYVDPLVAAGAMPGAASDVFALGAVAFHALCGEPLWPDGDPAEVFDTAALGVPEDLPLRLADAGVPGPVADVVLRALANEPELRGTAADFALDLRYADQPVPLELRAGRARPPGGEVVAALTHGVRLRSPLPAERPPGRRRWLPRWFGRAPGRCRTLRPRLLGGLLVGAGALLCVLALAAGRDGHRPLAPGHAPPAAEPTVPGRAATALAPDPLAIRGALQRLDALRERAYAERDPALLARVYLSSELVERDSALLRRLVPPGCGLVGVRTDYGEPAVESAGADEVRVRVTATLGASTLRCAGADAATAAGSGPELERIVLRRAGAGYRIAALAR